MRLVGGDRGSAGCRDGLLWAGTAVLLIIMHHSLLCNRNGGAATAALVLSLCADRAPGAWSVQ